MKTQDKIKRLIEEYRILQYDSIYSYHKDSYKRFQRDLKTLIEPECKHENTYDDTRGLDTYPVIRCEECGDVV